MIDMWHSEDNPKDVTPGIYELEGDRLTICFVDKRGGIRPTVFESKKGSDVSLWALKRDKNAAPSIEEKEPNIAEFPTAIIGKWAFVSGETTFGLFVRDTEFTKDGRVLQQERSQKKEFVERYKYRFDKDVLVLILPEKDRDGSTERRVRIASISEDKLVATSPSGTLRRLK